MYRRYGVPEYVVWSVERRAIDWFVLRDGAVRALGVACGIFACGGFATSSIVKMNLDGTATVDTTYTYRARCKVGAIFSPYSAEMSANPVR